MKKAEHLSDIENRLRHLLNHDPPEPKFQLWQNVSQGQITGFYWRSVGYAYNSGGEPGWYYYVQDDFDQEVLPEDEIEPLEDSATA